MNLKVRVSKADKEALIASCKDNIHMELQEYISECFFQTIITNCLFLSSFLDEVKYKSAVKARWEASLSMVRGSSLYASIASVLCQINLKSLNK